MRTILFFGLLFTLAGMAGAEAETCDWQDIEHATISIDSIPGGYRAVFQGGNCTFSAEGPEVLPALDGLLASLWCDWSASKEVY